MNNWRAVGHTAKGTEHLIYISTSAEQVKKNFNESFYELLTTEEQVSITRITLEKWVGKPTSGNWNVNDSLKVPRVQKVVK